MSRPFFKARYAKTRENGLEHMLRLALERAGEPCTTKQRFGRYETDFYLPRLRLVVEADGERWHPDAETAQKSVWARKRYEDDRRRDAYLESLGLAVCRLRGSEIRNNADLAVSRMLATYRERGLCLPESLPLPVSAALPPCSPG